MKKKDIAVHQLLVDYIDQIGCSDIPEQLLEVATARECASWNANYRIAPSGNQWVLTVFRYASDSPLFKMGFRRLFPSKVVADIMGRYHCRLINSAIGQANTSRPSAFPGN
jgi:hypothetical protein